MFLGGGRYRSDRECWESLCPHRSESPRSRAMSNVNPPATATSPPSPKRRRLWLWFLVGFVVVFLALAMLYPMYSFDGRAVHRTTLWRYYLLEMQQAWNSTGAIGPTSGNSAAGLTTFVIHVLISAVAGTGAMAVGWILQRRSRQA